VPKRLFETPNKIINVFLTASPKLVVGPKMIAIKQIVDNETGAFYFCQLRLALKIK